MGTDTAYSECSNRGLSRRLPLDSLKQWAVTLSARTHHNKAACALADKLARICYGLLRDATRYGDPQPRLARKFARTSSPVAA